MYYLTGGSGDPLIVLHGGSEGSRAWRNNAELLAEHYTVYVPDLPGFGQSEALTGDYFLPEMAQFVDGFARGVGLEKFHLMGHSLGGGIALHYVLRFPHRINKLVLVSSLCLGKEIALWVRCLSHPKVIRYAGRAVLGILKAVKWLAVNLTLAPLEKLMPFTATSVHIGRYITGFKEQATVFLDRLSEIIVPTLVVWGARDIILPYRQAFAAARLIPDCRVKVFRRAGHSVYREQLAEFSHLLRGFLG